MKQIVNIEDTVPSTNDQYGWGYFFTVDAIKILEPCAYHIYKEEEKYSFIIKKCDFTQRDIDFYEENEYTVTPLYKL